MNTDKKASLGASRGEAEGRRTIVERALQLQLPAYVQDMTVTRTLCIQRIQCTPSNNLE